MGGNDGSFPFWQWITSGLEYNAISNRFSAFEYNSFGLQANNILISATNTLTTTFNSYVVFGGYEYFPSPPVAQSKYFGDVVVRAYPPNGIEPSLSFGGVFANLAAGAPIESNSVIYSGGSSTLTAEPTGGISPYSYGWFSSTSGNPSCNNANVVVGASSQTYVASPTSNTFYSYNVIDSETPNAVACSTAVSVIVNPSTTTTTIPQSSGGGANTGGVVPQTTSIRTTTSTTTSTASSAPTTSAASTPSTSSSALTSIPVTTTAAQNAANSTATQKSGQGSGILGGIASALEANGYLGALAVVVVILIAGAAYVVARRRR